MADFRKGLQTCRTKKKLPRIEYKFEELRKNEISSPEAPLRRLGKLTVASFVKRTVGTIFYFDECIHKIIKV